MRWEGFGPSRWSKLRHLRPYQNEPRRALLELLPQIAGPPVALVSRPSNRIHGIRERVPRLVPPRAQYLLDRAVAILGREDAELLVLDPGLDGRPHIDLEVSREAPCFEEVTDRVARRPDPLPEP